MARTRELAYFRRVEADTAGRDGFTLIELLVVMAILAGLVAIALPPLSNLFSRVRASFERSDIEQQLLQLPQQVRQSGHSGVLVDPQQKGAPADLADSATARDFGELGHIARLQIVLPEGWTMRVAKPLYYNFNGVCSGGEIDLSRPPQLFHYVLVAPVCRPQLVRPHAQ